MAEQKPKVNTPMPGTPTVAKTHRVLYMRSEPTADFKALASYEKGNAGDEQQGEYLFASIRAEYINRARAAAAPIPFFLEQSEKNGLKVED